MDLIFEISKSNYINVEVYSTIAERIKIKKKKNHRISPK